MMVGMDLDVELLVVPDCPHQSAAAQLIHTALVDVGVPTTQVRTTVISTAGDAERRGFTGSPTFLLNGIDPFAEPGRLIGLSCRRYRSATGFSGVPDVSALRQALKRAADQS